MLGTEKPTQQTARIGHNRSQSFRITIGRRLRLLLPSTSIIGVGVAIVSGLSVFSHETTPRENRKVKLRVVPKFWGIKWYIFPFIRYTLI